MVRSIRPATDGERLEGSTFSTVWGWPAIPSILIGRGGYTSRLRRVESNTFLSHSQVEGDQIVEIQKVSSPVAIDPFERWLVHAVTDRESQRDEIHIGFRAGGWGALSV